MTDLQAEMMRRVAADGIPRYITEDGRIMKCDWELATQTNIDLNGQTLEEYIQSLIDNASEEVL